MPTMSSSGAAINLLRVRLEEFSWHLTQYQIGVIAGVSKYPLPNLLPWFSLGRIVPGLVFLPPHGL